MYKKRELPMKPRRSLSKFSKAKESIRRCESDKFTIGNCRDT